MWKAHGKLLGSLLVRRCFDQLRSREGVPQQRRGAAAQQAETLLGGPLSLALQSAMDAGETLSVDLDRELAIRRPALHEQLRQEAMQRAIDQIGENRKSEAASRAASTPTPAQLAEQLRQSKQEAINGQQGRVPMPVQISDV